MLERCSNQKIKKDEEAEDEDDGTMYVRRRKQSGLSPIKESRLLHNHNGYIGLRKQRPETVNRSTYDSRNSSKMRQNKTFGSQVND